MNSAYDFYAKDILKKCCVADFIIAWFSLTLAAHLGPYYKTLWRKGQECRFDAVFQGFLSSLNRRNIRNMAISHASDVDAHGIGRLPSS
jgi:hypothetical protein